MGVIYENVYQFLCGAHPHERFWHHQWLPSRIVQRDLRPALEPWTGSVLDVGCGQSPYKPWIGKKNSGTPPHYTGLDTAANTHATVVVSSHAPWPFPDRSFDYILCTQVLEHGEDLTHLLNESHRVLKPTGQILFTCPFIYNVHGAPQDYRRFTSQGLRLTLQPFFTVLEVKHQGAIGSTLGTLCLNWINQQTHQFLLTGLLKSVFMPLWMLFCAAINTLAWVLDLCDQTDSYYQNVLIRAQPLSGPPKSPTL